MTFLSSILKDKGLLASFALAGIWFALLSSTSRYWDHSGFIWLPSGVYILFLSLPLLALALCQKVPAISAFDPRGFALWLIPIAMSDWLAQPYSFLPTPIFRGELLLFFIIALSLPKNVILLLLQWSPIIASIIFILSFCYISSGRTIFTDDHSVFLFRFSLLKENFPYIPFYYPLWNLGMDARDFFATGSLNVFLLFSPLWYLFSPEVVYNFVLLSILFFILPLSVYAAAKLEKIPSPGPAVAALISMCTSLYWYRWCFKYGTMGFILSTALLPLVHSLAIRLIDEKRNFAPLHSIGLITLCSLMLFWAPSGLALLGVLIASLFCLHKLIKRRAVWVCAGFLLLINLPWISLMMKVSKIGTFIQSESKAAVHAELDQSPEQKDVGNNHRGKALASISLSKALDLLRESLSGAQPLWLFLLIPGIFLLPNTKSRCVFLCSTITLLILGTLISQIKPQLELDRMLIMLGLLSAVPAAAAFAALFKETERSFLLTKATSLAFLCAGIAGTTTIINNRSMEQYTFEEGIVSDISKAIIKYGGLGRTLFSGSVLHEMNNAHLAPLSIFTSHPLIASSQFHNLWKYKDVIPNGFLDKGTEGIEHFLDLTNTTSVMSHEPQWLSYFNQHSDLYRAVWKGGRFSMFTRSVPNSSYFLEGTGIIISQDDRRVRFSMEGASAILKFRYFPFLEVPGCKVQPFNVLDSEGLELIKLYDCEPRPEYELASKSVWQRFWN